MQSPAHNSSSAGNPVSSNSEGKGLPPKGLRRHLIPVAVFVLLMLGCSAADLVQRQREEATPSPTATQVALVPTFTATPIPAQQTVVIVTPPSEDQPGVIIVPPGMD